MLDQSEARPIEPMLRLNHTGYGIKIKDLVTVIIFIFMGGGAYYLVNYKLDELQGQQVGIKSAIEQKALDIKGQVDERLTRLEKTIDDARRERVGDIKDLQEKVAKQQTEAARIGEQVNNLQLLMGDLRDYLKRQGNQGYRENDLINPDDPAGIGRDIKLVVPLNCSQFDSSDELWSESGRVNSLIVAKVRPESLSR